MTGNREYRLAVLEDEPHLRNDLIEFLQLQGYGAQAAGSIQEFRTLIKQFRPDVVLLDLRLPDGNGLQLIPELRSTANPCGIIVLSSLGGLEHRVQGLDTGADAYLVKDAALREIDATIRAVLRRLTGTAPTPAWRFSRCTWLLTAPNDRDLRLTSSEAVIVSLLLQHPGEPVNRELISYSLPRPREGSDRSLDAMINRLRVKVERATGISLPINTVYSLGYSFTAKALLSD